MSLCSYFFITRSCEERKSRKNSKIERKILKIITSAQKQKRQNTLHDLSIQFVSNNILSEPSSEFLFSVANSEMIDTVTARLHKLILAVQDSSTTFVRRREFSEFLPPTEICRSVYYEHRFVFRQFNEILTEISEKDFSTQISAALNAFSHEAESFLKATVTLPPESFRLLA